MSSEEFSTLLGTQQKARLLRAGLYFDAGVARYGAMRSVRVSLWNAE